MNEEELQKEAERDAELREIRVKKLMTLVRSKYFMLKANFPKQALLVD